MRRFIGAVCGLKSEAEVLRRAVPDARLRIAVSGADAARAESLAAEFCRSGAAAIVSVGMAGGLAPDLRPGELVVGDVVRTAADEFFEANKALEFDRAASFGMHLDIPAGTAVRFEPGESKEVTLVAFGGTGEIFGLNSLTDGTTRGEGRKQDALDKARARRFKGA